MSEEDKGAMEKKQNSRQSSVPPKASNNDNKKAENGQPKNQKGKRRGNGGFNGNNFSYNEGPVRKPTPQKYKNTWDKRPRSRGGVSDRPRSDLEEQDVLEYGSAFQTGSKKGSLNHLLNFSYAPVESSQGYHGGAGSGSWSRGRQLRYRNSYSNRGRVCFNKEQFLQANCQFVVRDGEDYSVHLMDPDVLVKWEAVEQVRVISLEEPSCPICLQYPTAAKMTRCGHIYCWACVLHYLALGEKNWRKCPICYESIHSNDLKSPGGSTTKPGLTRKDELYNKLVDMFQKRKLSFPKADANEQGSYFVQILCNSLWYITNHHQTINDAAQHRPGVVPVPPCFEEFTGYAERKRKKQKQLQMTSIELNSHGQALYSLLLKPIIKTSPEWAAAYNDIKALADCLLSYRTYLEKQATIQEHNRSLDHPVRTVDQFTTVEPRRSSVGVKESYSVIVREVQHYKAGDTVTMTLMKKEKGSIYAVPANYWTKQAGKCHNINEPSEMTHHLKLLTAKPYQVLEIIETEKKQLEKQLADCEPSEEPFIIAAQAQLKEREESVTGVKKIREELSEKQSAIQPNTSPEVTSVPTKTHVSSKKIKKYKSAFSDEEDEGSQNDEPAPHGTENDSEFERTLVVSDGNTSRSMSSGSDDHVTETTQHNDRKSPRSSPPIPVNSLSGPTDPDKFAVGSPEGSNPPIEVIPDIMPVEEAAEHLELPAQGDSKARKKSGDESFYFYQAADGQHLYLHSLNARCLVREYGSLENSPQQITATIVEKESVFVTEELRKRLRYLSHLPLTCGFEVIELAIKQPVLGKDSLKYFHDEFEKRRKMRQRRNRDEKRRARQIEEDERKRLGIPKGTTIIRSQFNQLPTCPSVPVLSIYDETRSDTSSPSLDTPVGSPLSHSVSAPDFQPVGGASQLDDGQTAVVSFAQMLKAGAQSTKWPSMKTDKKEQQTSPSSSTTSGRHGSDESDNEDKVPVPEFHSSFGSAIEAAFENIGSKNETEVQKSTPGSGKKKKKQLVLFSTSMARGGK